MNLGTSDNKRVESQYKISVFPQRRNFVYKFKLENGILCRFCQENQKNTTGRKKKWFSLNSLHAHCSFDHYNFDFRDYLIELARKIINGDLK